MARPYTAWDEISNYARYILAVFLPGRDPGTFEVNTNVAQEIDGWEEDDYRLLIEEGRRRLDRQYGDFDRLIGRAQSLFTTAVGLLVVIGASFGRIIKGGRMIELVLWSAGVIMVTAGLLGASALMAVKARFSAIEPANLTTLPAPVLPALAAAYPRMVKVGDDTISTRITVYRDAVVLILFGGIAHTAVWVLAILRRYA